MWSSLPAQIKIFLLAALPIGEIRIALPVGLTLYDVPVWQALFFGISGNMVAAVIVYLFLHACGDSIVTHVPVAHRYLEKYLERARHVFTGKYQRWGVLGLILFVGIPLPMTGAWTGAAAAYVFGFPKKKTLTAIFIGICLASLIMLTGTLGVEFILSLLV